jgi:hypothetical protein
MNYATGVTQCKTKDVAAASAEGGDLMAIQTNDPRITLVAGGYSIFAQGKLPVVSVSAAELRSRTVRSQNTLSLYLTRW